MTALENPDVTIARLIRQNIRVLKDDGNSANILVINESYDREFLRERDGQITVNFDQSTDQKLELVGRLRRRILGLRSNIYTVDKTVPGVDPGQVMRDKIIAEINRIIRENRNVPNQASYDFVGLGYPSGDPHKAFQSGASTEISPDNPLWIELTNTEYVKVWYSDDNRYSKSHNVNNEYAMMLFRFKMNAREDVIKQIVLSFEGYGTAPGGNGFLIEVWNHVAGAWQQAQASPASAEDSTVSITLLSDITNYVDANGYVWLFARTYHASDGETAAILNCDYVKCTIQVNGITFCDVVTYRNMPINPEVKPFVFQTEFILKGWFFEMISGV
jgi:hypothetical protein